MAVNILLSVPAIHVKSFDYDHVYMHNHNDTHNDNDNDYQDCDDCDAYEEDDSPILSTVRQRLPMGGTSISIQLVAESQQILAGSTMFLSPVQHCCCRHDQMKLNTLSKHPMPRPHIGISTCQCQGNTSNSPASVRNQVFLLPLRSSPKADCPVQDPLLSSVLASPPTGELESTGLATSGRRGFVAPDPLLTKQFLLALNDSMSKEAHPIFDAEHDRQGQEEEERFYQVEFGASSLSQPIYTSSLTVPNLCLSPPMEAVVSPLDELFEPTWGGLDVHPYIDVPQKDGASYASSFV